MVVVGDVDPDAIHSMAKKYFGEYKSNPLPVVKLRTEVEQLGPRKVTLKLPAKLASLRMGYKTPAMISAKQGKVPQWEPYALEVLTNILDGGDSARFSKNLVRGKEVAAGANSGYFGYGRLDNLLVISATPAKGVSTQKLQELIIAEIETLKTELVNENELKRVKAQVIAGEVYERDSIEHMATLLGSLDAVGLGHNYIDQFVPGVLAVTAQQIQDVAKKYLIENNLTVAELIPLPLDEKQEKQ